MNQLLPGLAAIVGLAFLPPLPQFAGEGRGKETNFRPICRIAPVAPVLCQGAVTSVQLDGSMSFDVDGDDLTYLWMSCPGSSFDDPTSATPTLTIDTSNNCDRTCGVRFQVSDGRKTSNCRIFVSVFDVTTAHLDIIPGECPNDIELDDFQFNMNNRTKVAVLGNDFDVTQANVSTLRMRRVFGGGDMMFFFHDDDDDDDEDDEEDEDDDDDDDDENPPPVGNEIFPVETEIEDEGTPFVDDGFCACHTLEEDGLDDISLEFLTLDLILAFDLGSEPDGTFVELEIVGELLDGTPFRARDCIRVVHDD